MKKATILFFAIVLLMAQSFAQTKVTAPIVRNANSDTTYGTHFDSLGYGGWVTFADLTERNAFPFPQRRVGMIAAIDTSLYILSGCIGNSCWQRFYTYQGSTLPTWQQTLSQSSNLTVNNNITNGNCGCK
jgi:hypothetical protein